MSSGRGAGRGGVDTPLSGPGDLDGVRAAVRRERLRLADLLDSLPARDWAAPSLCTEWRVQDVAAHLTLTTRATRWSVLKEAVWARGSFDRMERDTARRRAGEFSPTDLVAQLREGALTDRRFPMSGPMDPLMDLVIHQMDVGRPLGVPDLSPLDVVTASATYVAGNRFLGGARRVAGLRLVATDADWSLGQGPVVSGPVRDLLLVVSGRPAGLPTLHGDGLATITARVA